MYRALVDFQVSVQATMIGHLSNKVAAAQQPTNPLHFMVYSPLYRFSAHAPSEYTLDLNQVNKSNIIWEMANWERGGSDPRRNGWAQDAGSHNYYFVLQQEHDASDLSDRIAKLPGIISSMRDPDTAPDPQTAAWQDSLGFWSNWNGSNPQAPPDHIWNKHKQQQFMTKIRKS